MFEKISYNLKHVEKMPYSSYGLLEYSKNKNTNPFNKTQKENIPIEKSPVNPFKSEVKNDFQKDFKENYKNIESFLKKVEFETSKGEIASVVSDAILDAGVLVSGFLCNKKLPKNSFLLIDRGKKTIKTFNYNNELQMETSIKNGDVSKIKLYKDDFEYKIDVYDKKLLDRLFNSNKTTLKQYQKFDKKGNLLEQIRYSKNGKMESYFKNNKNSKQEILFDTNKYALNSDFVPLRYNFYKNNIKTKSLKYSYAIPFQYEEYDETTSKTTKILKLQGIKPKVSKYMFFNSLNGNLITSGTA